MFSMKSSIYYIKVMQCHNISNNKTLPNDLDILLKKFVSFEDA